jgi:hypothetical protein
VIGRDGVFQEIWHIDVLYLFTLLMVSLAGLRSGFDGAKCATLVISEVNFDVRG